MDLSPYIFCLSFYLLYFVLPPFKDNGLLFWVPDVLCQHSEVVLWNLLGSQMFFRWICGRESGLPVLFLRHLRTAPQQAYFNFMATLTICNDFGPQENKISHYFHFFPICLPWSDRTGYMNLVSWLLSFRPAFSFSSFTFIKRLFNLSSLSVIRVVSSAYLRWLIFLPAFLIPA